MNQCLEVQQKPNTPLLRTIFGAIKSYMITNQNTGNKSRLLYSEQSEHRIHTNQA